ncbi:putative BSD domain-containing protein [Helianthus annuus]|uniref:BSD domain-containing protein n=1 Tax=Helianthus annuus TaxID=4232 RepID=A0A9K3JCJ4_HELAN|nr:putative BSD domain-containing protein [Helianthus annuus]KAJ0495661.1 putative BSD domain-containing protein [Helianthus annuus]KAJ0606343.1 putative BSD domain-containing protein [Helianthus annuus]KAJ0766435.1 putative BSD domain-containing protein [Helianthus annuus]KAJ0933635.1 putative BSD domain-containing protein [Helianthus annuus]
MPASFISNPYIICPHLPFQSTTSSQDFELTDAQQEHALTVESLAPRLAALRIELCPGYMSESSFWKIYFVLLHPRLEPHAAALLSTPEVIDPECIG